MTITLVDVKQFFIARLKVDSLVQAALPTDSKQDIREVEWQGTDFVYPNIRVRVEQFERSTPGADCLLFNYITHIYVFTEDASSLLADQIAAAIWLSIDTKSLATATIKLPNMKATHYGAVWIPEEGTWRSEVLIVGKAS